MQIGLCRWSNNFQCSHIIMWLDLTIAICRLLKAEINRQTTDPTKSWYHSDWNLFTSHYYMCVSLFKNETCQEKILGFRLQVSAMVLHTKWYMTTCSSSETNLNILTTTPPVFGNQENLQTPHILLAHLISASDSR